MLEQVSWKEFLIAIGSGCAAYYGVLAIAGKIRFTRSHTKTITPDATFPGNKLMATSSTSLPTIGQEQVSGPLQQIAEDPRQADDPEFNALELLADELQVIITQFDATSTNKEKLLAQLRQEIARYPTLNQLAFQRAVSNLIIKVTKEECQLTITDEEARECWPEG